jgi:hypothetical protein
MRYPMNAHKKELKAIVASLEEEKKLEKEILEEAEKEDAMDEQ